MSQEHLITLRLADHIDDAMAHNIEQALEGFEIRSVEVTYSLESYRDENLMSVTLIAQGREPRPW